MPNKTIYVSDSDLSIYDRAQDLAGGNLSRAIALALRRYVEVEEGKSAGFEEVIVSVGPGAGRRQRFLGVLLAEVGHSTKDRVETYRVYQSRTGKYVVHITRSPEFIHTAGADGSARGLRKYLSPNQTWGSSAPSATLEIVDTLDELKDLVPAELYEMVAAAVDQPVIEDLDI